ncbi:MAG: arginine--tRNA ligase [Armatimonadetes bacterium]|nr:arginine--tRNA ligase [Armatimonadota bacterium]
MLRQVVAGKIEAAIARLVSRGALAVADYPTPEVMDTKQPEHGDFATNWAMMAVKLAGKNPRELGEMLAGELATDPELTKAEVAGPGFVNITLESSAVSSFLESVLGSAGQSVLDDAGHYARPQSGLTPRSKINIEFVSVNPNGPITIGSGRGAAYGSTLANVLQAAGNEVHREYYINDGVNSEQMRLFAESVKAMVLGQSAPENGYKGDYVAETAKTLQVDGAKALLRVLALGSHRFDSETVASLEWIGQCLGSGVKYTEAFGERMASLGLSFYQSVSQDLMLAKQRQDLAAFGVTFDTWFSEQSLHDSGKVDQCIGKLKDKGVADDEPVRTKVKLAKGGVLTEVEHESQVGKAEVLEEDGHGDDPPTTPSSTSGTTTTAGEAAASEPSPSETSATLWLRSTLFGDDMDRVLRRKDGRLTYIASDVAYHEDKFNRPANADKLITVLGPDHHGYIGRLHAVVAADLMPEGVAADVPVGGAWASDSERDLYGGNLALRDKCQAAKAESDKRLEVLIFQLVRFVKDGKPAPMRKRDGNIYALIDLVNEIGQMVKPEGTTAEKQEAGKDVARFFYLMRNHDTTFDFDLDLAAKQSDENPVFYVQYAHARICGVLRKAEEAGFAPPTAPSSTGALHPKERALLLKILDLPYEVLRCAEDYAVNRLTTYATELARTYHHFYDACRVIEPQDPETTVRRLAYCQAARTALKATFDLLGVSAPEKM